MCAENRTKRSLLPGLFLIHFWSVSNSIFLAGQFSKKGHLLPDPCPRQGEPLNYMVIVSPGIYGSGNP